MSDIQLQPGFLPHISKQAMKWLRVNTSEVLSCITRQLLKTIKHNLNWDKGIADTVCLLSALHRMLEQVVCIQKPKQTQQTPVPHLLAVCRVIEVGLGIRMRHSSRVSPHNVEIGSSIHPCLAVPLDLCDCRPTHSLVSDCRHTCSLVSDCSKNYLYTKA